MISGLKDLGWTDADEAALRAEDAGPELWVARVVGQHRREYDVRREQGVVRAVLAGKRWAKNDELETLEIQPVVGDWVLCRSGPGSDAAPIVERVLKRRTLLARGAAGRNGKGQVVAANIDWIVVVAAFTAEDARESVQKRSLNPRRIERYLTAIQAGGARSLVLLNKCDLSERAEETLTELRARLPGTLLLLLSTKTGRGRTELEQLFRPRETVGFVGLSGVGKSSIVNFLTQTAALPTQPARAKDGRGRHTTTHRELFETEHGFLLIDTPGMREFSLADADEEDLSVFDDVVGWAAECRFGDCTHWHEPGCRVRRAVDEGQLAPERLASFQALRAEMAEKRRLVREKRAPLKARPKRP